MDWPGPTTHRQYLAWQKWLQLQWNEPNRSDHYLMQIAQVIVQQNAKEPRSVISSMFKIPFKFVSRLVKGEQQLTRKQRIQLSKAAWGAWTGAGKPPETNDGN